MHDGQVLSGEEHHDGGLRAERVVVERPESLSFFEDALEAHKLPAKSKDILLTALLHSFTLACR